MAIDATLTTECIKSANKWGETVYTNICTGGTHVVPWGGLDYLGVIGAIAFVTAVVLPFLFMVISILRD